MIETDIRPIPDFPGYFIDLDGNVWSNRRLNKMRILTAFPKKGGYLSLRIFKNKQQFWIYPHRLVMEIFVGPRPPGKEVLHGDGNPANNHICNLRYGTRVENMADAREHGRIKTGKDSYWGKRTHCPYGHEYSTENTRINHNGARECIECRRAKDRRVYWERKSK